MAFSVSKNPTDSLIEQYEGLYGKKLVRVADTLNEEGVCFALSFYWIYLIRSEKPKEADSKEIIQKLSSIQCGLLNSTNQDLNDAIKSENYKKEIQAWFNTKVAWKFDIFEIFRGNTDTLGRNLRLGLEAAQDQGSRRFCWHMVFGFDYTYHDGRRGGHTTAILRVPPSGEHKFFDPNIGIFTFPGDLELAEWLVRAYWPYKETTRTMTGWDLGGISAQKF